MSIADKLTTIANNVPLVYEAGMAAGFQPPEVEADDPEWVYQTTRPKDWFPMPVPADDEIWCLGLIPDGSSGAFGANLTFTGDCTVEAGTLVDGEFVVKQSVAPVSGTTFRIDMLADDYSGLTSDGYKQYLVRMAGGITKYNAAVASSDTIPTAIFVVDIACGIQLNGYTYYGNNSAPDTGLVTLRYLRFLGNGHPGYFGSGYFCTDCFSLLSVTCEKQISVERLSRAFSRCRSIRAVSPQLLTISGVADAKYLFESSSIRRAIITGQPTDLSFAYRATSLTSVSGNDLDTSACTNFSHTFYECRALKKVIGLDISSATNFTNTFGYAYLDRLTFAGETTPGGTTITLTYAMMAHSALVEMINSLPTATAAATLTITGNPGASELTDEEIAVATARNWTITI